MSHIACHIIWTPFLIFIYIFGIVIILNVCLGMIRELVLGGQRLELKDIPNNVPKEITSLIEECWDQQPTKRPCFTGIQLIIMIYWYTKYFIIQVFQ